MQASGTRVLFYSHDTFGLGHIRRTLAICGAVLDTLDDVSILVVTGSSALPSLQIPRGVDYVKLPSVTKVAAGRYDARFLRDEFEFVRRLREGIIFSTVAGFQPTMVFVDNVPLGLKGEMVRTLDHLRAHHPETRTILTLRDVLDEPSRIIGEWTRQDVYSAIERFYDQVLVYGSPAVFDLVREYHLPAQLARKVTYAGYIGRASSDRAVRRIRRRLVPEGGKLVLVTVGGGEDGYGVVERYLDGRHRVRRTGSVRSVAVLGPDMPEAGRTDLKRRFGRDRDVTFVDVCGDLTSLIAAADVVVSMGGYNTVCEILSLGRPSVIVPRVEPRLEQWIRCRRLADLGLLQVIHPLDATAERLAAAVTALLDDGVAVDRVPIAFDGLRHVSAVVRACAEEQPWRVACQ
jgi:predicted glycosyltransferase